ncbi:MAG: chemotaxis protein CheW [Clostridiales Family XIII bacterium]|jgi:purine-binding chemotaxis protein CheW|nr:chemotaxis protein CheW [Clostridiales Family XIII bacterium]
MNEFINEFAFNLPMEYEEPEDEVAGLYLICDTGGGRYAVPVADVNAIVAPGGYTPVPEAPDFILGLIEHRGDLVPVVSVRRLFGMKLLAEELEELMRERIHEHTEWVRELEESVRTGRDVTVETDPHKCRFGRWYDQFRTSNSVLNALLLRIDEPHKAIHETAIRAKQLVALGRREEAASLVQEMKDTHFRKTMDLLRAASAAYVEGSREIVIVVEVPDGHAGIRVDSIETIAKLEDTAPPPDMLKSVKAVQGYVTMPGEESAIGVLDVQYIAHYASEATAALAAGEEPASEFLIE